MIYIYYEIEYKMMSNSYYFIFNNISYVKINYAFVLVYSKYKRFLLF